MDSINSNMRIGNTSAVQASYKAPAKVAKAEVSLVSADNFTSGISSDIPTKPVITDKPVFTTADLGILGTYSPAVQAGLSAMGEGSPIFKGLAGTIAKWLITTQEEVKLGQMIKGQVEGEMSISKDPQLNARVKNLGEKLAANSSRKDISYEFKVIDDDTINAFACPGGFIYVHKGLLERFPDDKHLAFIIGHEVGHVEHRDSIDKLGTNFVLQIIQTAMGKIPGKLDDMLAGAAGMLYDSTLSQKAEYAADLTGAQHMEKLGIDPKYGAEALRGLESAGQKEPGLLERLFSTHPPTEKRAQKLDKYSAGKH